MDPDNAMSSMLAVAYPPVVDVGDRSYRDWMVSVAQVVPSDVALGDLGKTIVAKVFDSLAEAYGALLTEADLEQLRPDVSLCRLDDRHLVVRTEFAGVAKSFGDSIAISQWVALQELDRRMSIEDLQGVPAGDWLFIRLAREAAASGPSKAP